MRQRVVHVVTVRLNVTEASYSTPHGISPPALQRACGCRTRVERVVHAAQQRIEHPIWRGPRDEKRKPRGDLQRPKEERRGDGPDRVARRRGRVEESVKDRGGRGYGRWHVTDGGHATHLGASAAYRPGLHDAHVASPSVGVSSERVCCGLERALARRVSELRRARVHRRHRAQEYHTAATGGKGG